MGGVKEREIARGAQMLSSPYASSAFFFFLMLSVDRKKAVTRDFHREKDELLLVCLQKARAAK